MRPAELMELLKQRANDPVFHQALIDDPLKALESKGFTVDAEDRAAVSAINWRLDDPYIVNKLGPIVFMWGTFTHRKLSEWVTRIDATAAGFVQWIAALRPVVQLYGNSSIYLMQSAGNSSAFTCFIVWKDQANAQSFFSSNEWAAFQMQNALAGVATQNFPTSLGQATSEVFDALAPSGAYCTVRTWTHSGNTAAAFESSLFAGLSAERQAGAGQFIDFIGGVIIQLPTNPVQFQVLTAYDTAQSATAIGNDPAVVAWKAGHVSRFGAVLVSSNAYTLV